MTFLRYFFDLRLGQKSCSKFRCFFSPKGHFEINQPLDKFKENLEQKGGYPILFGSNVFHNSHLIQNCTLNRSATAADFVYISESNESGEK